MSDIQNDEVKGGDRSVKVLVKSGFWFTASNFLIRSLSFLTIPIFSRIMSKAEMGDFSVFASWQSIFLIFCGVEIYGTLNRARFDYKTEEEMNGYISSGMLLSFIVTTVFFVTYLLFPNILDGLFLLDERYIIVMFIYLYMEPSFLMFLQKQRIAFKYKLASILSLSLIVISTVSSAVLVILAKEDKLMARIIGQYVPHILVGLVFYIFFFIKSRKISIGAIKYALRLGIPMVFTFLGGQVLLASDKFVIKHMGTAEELAILFLASSCAHIILIFEQSLNYSWSPWFYDKLHVGKYHEIDRTFKVYIGFIILCTFCVLLMGPEIVAVLGGKPYKDAIWILPANLINGVLMALGNNLINVEVYYKKNYYSAVIAIIFSAINIGGDIIGVMLWGFQAVCYVTVICNVLRILVHYLICIKLDRKAIMSFRVMMIYIAITLALVPVSLLLYGSNIIRWSFTGVLFTGVAVISFIKRKQIKNYIKALVKEPKKAKVPKQEA